MLLVWLSLLLLLPSPGAAPAPTAQASAPCYIAPGGAEGGVITVHSAERELVSRFGPANVRDADVDVGEGNTVPGTVLFANDPLRHIEIIWRDVAKRNAPTSVRIDGARSCWHTVHGITLGTSLHQLEQFNHHAFTLTGFGWDYSGTVISWDGGRLEQELGQKAGAAGWTFIRLEYASTTTPDAARKKGANSVQGDGNFSSANPAMQSLNPTVYEIVWSFAPPSGGH